MMFKEIIYTTAILLSIFNIIGLYFSFSTMSRLKKIALCEKKIVEKKFCTTSVWNMNEEKCLIKADDNVWYEYDNPPDVSETFNFPCVREQ